MKIAILGGVFDPPHIGHYLVATQVKEILQMDEVWLMPCYSYFPEFPIKFSHITTPEKRMEMARMFKDHGLRVVDYEFEKNKKSRTIDTLRLLEKERSNDIFYWIVGSDTLPTFQLWNEWKELVTKHNIIVFPRDTDITTLQARVLKYYDLSTIPHNITVVEGNVIVSNIASTHIRNRVRAKLSISHMVLPEVEKYIYKHGLYKPLH